MRRISYTPYALLLLALFFLTSLPSSFTMSLRSLAVYSVSPTWRGVNSIKKASLQLLALPTVSNTKGKQKEDKFEELQRENRALAAQLENLRQWLVNEDRIEEQLARVKELKELAELDPEWKDFYKRRALEISKILELQSQAIPAKVVYREPASWSSFVWINMGEKHNKALGRQVVAKNSPVIVNGCLAGVVEDVRNSQSRVRLITDANLMPSVRTLRGKKQNEQLWQQLESIFHALEARRDLFQSSDEQKAFVAFFSRIKSRISTSSHERYLAKGELHGGSAPLWRARGAILQGIGFNYDRADAEGPARDLRSGRSKDAQNSLESLAILKEGDLLVTSGFDGVFPAGLPVAIVKKIENLREGASAYELKAEAAAGSLNDLSTVFVLPSLGFDKSL